VRSLRLKNVRSLKVFEYEYESRRELEKHKEYMLKAKFEIEKQDERSIEFSQIIKESE